MDSFGYVLLVLLVVLFVYIYWEDKRNWELVYESTGLYMQSVQSRFSYLRANGVKCRIKTSGGRSISFSSGMGSSGMVSVKLEVHKRDLEKAYRLLAEFR